MSEDSEVHDLLKEAGKVLDKEGWANGYLYNPHDGSHCALGAIGKARFGPEFDNTVRVGHDKWGNHADPYGMLMNDPIAAKAMVAVANEIHRSSSRPELFLDPDDMVSHGGHLHPRAVIEALNLIVPFNDGQNDNGTEGSAKVRRLFTSAKQRFYDKIRYILRKEKVVAPPKVELEVEYVPAPLVTPNGLVEEVHETIKQEVV